MATSNCIKSVVICVLVLGSVLEQIQAAEITCCRTTEARTCFNYCGGSRPLCAGACGCIIMDGSNCPSNYPKLHLLPVPAEPDATEYCAIGCRTSVCDSIDNVFGGQDMKFDMELCSNACVRFCNEGAVIPTVSTESCILLCMISMTNIVLPFRFQ